MQTNYTHFTDLEAHAELCYAEALLLRALLSFIEDETLTSLIHAGMKIQHCYNSYKSVLILLTFDHIKHNDRISEGALKYLYKGNGNRMC